jgi:hypothetical protein
MTEAAHADKSFFARTIGKRRLRSSPGKNRSDGERYEEKCCSESAAAMKKGARRVIPLFSGRGGAALRDFRQAHSLVINFPPVTVGRSARPLRIYVVFK